MRLVTFDTAEGQRRIGSVTSDQHIVDLNAAASLYLRDVEQDPLYDRVADARVPNNMRGLFEGGDRSLTLARQASEHARQFGPEARGPAGETLFHQIRDVKL